jgi:hypothetical protein
MYLHPAMMKDLNDQIRTEHVRRASRVSVRHSLRRPRVPQTALVRAGPLRLLRLLRV